MVNIKIKKVVKIGYFLNLKNVEAISVHPIKHYHKIRSILLKLGISFKKGNVCHAIQSIRLWFKDVYVIYMIWRESRVYGISFKYVICGLWLPAFRTGMDYSSQGTKSYWCLEQKMVSWSDCPDRITWHIISKSGKINCAGWNHPLWMHKKFPFLL